MEAVKKRRTVTKPSSRPAVIAIGSTLLREAWGFSLLGMTVFIGLSLFSYHREDSAFNHAGSGNIQNLAGRIGAYLADFLYQVLGYGAILLPLLAGIIGWQLLRQRSATLGWERMVAAPVLVLVGALLFEMFAPGVAGHGYLPAGAGGVVGYFIGTLMKQSFGVWGSAALLLPLGLFSLMIVTQLSLVSLIDRLITALHERFASADSSADDANWLERVGDKLKHLRLPEVPGAVSVPATESKSPPAVMAESPPPVARREGRGDHQPELKLEPALDDTLPPMARSAAPKPATPATREAPRWEDDEVALPAGDDDDLILEPRDLPSWRGVLDARRAPPVAEEAARGGAFTAEAGLAPVAVPATRAQPGVLAPIPPLVAVVAARQEPSVPVVSRARPRSEPALELTEPEEPDFSWDEERSGAVPDSGVESPPVSRKDWELPALDDGPDWEDEEPSTLPVPEPVRERVAQAVPVPRPVVAREVSRPVPIASGDGQFPLPPLSLLEQASQAAALPEREGLNQMARLLERKLGDFSVKGRIIDVRPGPVVTTFELDPEPGLKASKVIGLADDLARSITASSVRVVGNIPGKSVIGIEIPNEKRQTVYLREILETEAAKRSTAPLTVALGVDINGNPVVADLAKMPHLLVAGTTGSGKSVAVNSMICSILFRAPPSQVRFLMVDPKMLEFSFYEGIPHLLAPVVTEVRKAANLLKWAVAEMEERYLLMSKLGVRNLEGYNQRVAQCRANGEQPTQVVKTGFDPETGKPLLEERPLPLEEKPIILILIDELADLMMQVGKEVEPAIARLAQKARAAGIHMVLATQRPSVDVITGLIKANFPTRLAFQVASRIDSRTILDAQGAEQLLGKGDGLFLPPGTSRVVRIHAPWISDGELHKLVDYLKLVGGRPQYNEAILAGVGDDEEEGEFGEGDGDDGLEEFYDQAVALVIKARKVSTSMVQRHFKIGYNRAARIVEKMEKEGLISPANSSGKREVLAGRREE